MTIVTTATDQILLDLHDIGAVKFGTFTLKSGIESPVYLDLRLIISYPKLLRQIGEALWNLSKDPCPDLICGVPYTALPIATVIAIDHNIPMLIRRKEAKAYGTKKIIEGVYKEGQSCLVIEDLITSGSSVLETTKPLKDEGLVINDIAIILDRQQGGRYHLEEAGYRVHSLTTMSQLLDTLHRNERIDTETCEKILWFIEENQT